MLTTVNNFNHAYSKIKTYGTGVPFKLQPSCNYWRPLATTLIKLGGASHTSGRSSDRLLEYQGDWSAPEKLGAMEKAQLELSDVISFHNYDRPEEFEKRVKWLQRYHRPILCTEYMARGNGSTFQGILPIARKYKIAAYNWGLVADKTQTNLPWDSWQHPYIDREPAIWFHEIFYRDGRPYRPAEVEFIRGMTGRGTASK